MSKQTFEKYAGIIEGLYLKTLSGSINWTSSTGDGYSCALGSSILVIREEMRSGTRDIAMYIYNNDGNLVDKFTDVDIVDISPSIDGFSDYFDLMDELLKRAGREASGAERLLDDILDKLKS